MKTEQVQVVSLDQSAGWNIARWCEAISVSRASFYLLANRPKTVKIGRRHVVIESPKEYLQRIADSQLKAA